MSRSGAAAAEDSEAWVSGLRFALLGTLMLADGAGDPVAVSGARRRALLASLLLSANVPVSSDVLAEAVWDGSPPPGAAATLRSHVRRLREALGPRAGPRITACDPVRAENRIHGSDQQSCTPGAPAVMITSHVPAVGVPPYHATSRVAAAVPA